jgi:predicted MFS family arabinose efflux permease
MVVLAGELRAPFRRFWLSGFLADFGDGIRLAAFPLLAVQSTHSPVAVAAVTAVQGLPWLVAGPVLGVLVDRTDRRQLMAVVNALQALVLTALSVAVVTHHAGLSLIYLAALVTGLGGALRGAAGSAAVPQLVPSADLDRANGQMIAGSIVGNELAGPAAGGWLFGLAAVLPFAVNAGALGIAVLLLLTLPSVFRPVPRELGAAPASRLAGVRRDTAEGFRWLWGHADIRDLTVAVGVISAMDAAWFAVLVLYVTEILGQRSGVYGLLLAVAALGGIEAGAYGTRLTRRLGPWPSVVISGLTLAVTQAGLGLTTSVILAAVLLAVSSGAFALFNITAVTMRQRAVPAGLLGRVNSLYGTVARGTEALGAIGGGALAAVAGIRAPMLIGAVPILLVTVALAWRYWRVARSRV